MNKEAHRTLHGEPILAIYQNQSHIIDPEKVMAVNEYGQFFKKEIKKDHEIISVYWLKRHKQIALLLLISSGLLFSILLNESNIFNIIFNTLEGTFRFLLKGIL